MEIMETIEEQKATNMTMGYELNDDRFTNDGCQEAQRWKQ